MLVASFYRLYDGQTRNYERLVDSEWHIGGSPKLINAAAHHIHRVSADCDELEYIKEKFSNIPMTNSRVVVWHGEFARFIAENL